MEKVYRIEYLDAYWGDRAGELRGLIKGATPEQQTRIKESLAVIDERPQKKGVAGYCHEVQLPEPKKTVTKNCRYYFTQLGWEKFGKKILAILGQEGKRCWVVCLKPSKSQIMYKDPYQVAIRPNKFL